MLFSRRIQREKALQSLYAYVHQRSATLSEVEAISQTEEVKSSSEKADALFELRGHLSQYIYTEEPSEQVFQEQVGERSSIYKPSTKRLFFSMCDVREKI